MPIIIVSPTQVEVDGVNYGAVADAIANNLQLASDIQLALNDWGDDLMQQVQDVPGLRSQITQLEQELERYRNPPQPAQDWVGLGQAIATSSLYTRLTGLIEDDVLEPPLETTLLSTLFRMGMAAAWIRSLPAFLEGVTKLREILAGTEHAITPEEEAETVTLLSQYGFSIPST